VYSPPITKIRGSVAGMDTDREGLKSRTLARVPFPSKFRACSRETCSGNVLVAWAPSASVTVTVTLKMPPWRRADDLAVSRHVFQVTATWAYGQALRQATRAPRERRRAAIVHRDTAAARYADGAVVPCVQISVRVDRGQPLWHSDDVDRHHPRVRHVVRVGDRQAEVPFADTRGCAGDRAVAGSSVRPPDRPPLCVNVYGPVPPAAVTCAAYGAFWSAFGSCPDS